MCQRVDDRDGAGLQPSLLIADEPTTGLDVTTQTVVMDLIVELTKRRGCPRSSSPTISGSRGNTAIGWW